jgi:prepilin-type N-terminal cleavage/methylation domain-containing protein
MFSSCRPYLLKKNRGFTLIELIVVIMIIALLMGLVLGVAGPVRQAAARSQAQAEIAALETALSRFEIDNGFYPKAVSIGVSGDFYQGDPNTADYQRASRALFLAVTGRSWLASTDVNTMGTSYMAVKESQVPPNQRGTSGSSNQIANNFSSYASAINEGSYLLDPWGWPYGYYYNPDAPGTPPRFSLNNSSIFDLWSTGNQRVTPDSGGNAHVLRQWIANWPTDF